MSAPSSLPVRRYFWVAVLLVYACAFQGARGIYSPDEGRYTDVALAMLGDGDWLHPMLHHEVAHWSKPPLTYWSIAASIRFFGRTEFAARLPSALAFAATVLLLVRLGRRFVPDRPWLPGLVYATFLLPPVASNLVTTDTILALWECLVVVGFVEAWAAQTRKAGRSGRLILGVAAGLAFLTKGPPGLLSLAGCLVFAVRTDGWRSLRKLVDPASALAFAIIGLGWYAYVVAQDPSVLHYFLVTEVVQRVATDNMHRNGGWWGPFEIYLPTLLVGALPWWPIAAARAWLRRRDAGATPAGFDGRLLLCWFWLPLVVFSIAQSRLPLYLLPLFAPLALWVAREIPDVISTSRRAWAAMTWAIMLMAMRGAAAWLDVNNDDRRLAAAIDAAIAPRPSEVAFVEDAPRFGLRLYLGSEVERLSLPDSKPPPQSQDISDELREREGCRLLLTSSRHAQETATLLSQRGARFRRLPDVRGYAAFAQITSDCVW